MNIAAHRECCGRHLKDNEGITGIQFVTDDKGRKVAVLIDLKRYGDRLQDFWDGLISESRRKDKGIPLEKVKANLINKDQWRVRMVSGGVYVINDTAKLPSVTRIAHPREVYG